MTFWQAYRTALGYLLAAITWIGCIAAPVGLIYWLVWRGWYWAAGLVGIAALAGALALQARDIQRRHL
jgi:hypothetical protein